MGSPTAIGVLRQAMRCGGSKAAFAPNDWNRRRTVRKAESQPRVLCASALNALRVTIGSSVVVELGITQEPRARGAEAVEALATRIGLGEDGVAHLAQRIADRGALGGHALYCLQQVEVQPDDLVMVAQQVVASFLVT